LKTTITTLVENTAQGKGLLAEHGLAFLIETRAGTILFDAGQGMVLLPNADVLEVDIDSAERIFLSHGHFDHTGGLRQVLSRIGSREVFAHPHALAPKYSVRRGETRRIGIPETREELEQAGARFCLHEEPVELLPGVTATGPVPRVTDFERVSSRFQTGSAGTLRQDELLDDQSLIVETDEGPVVVLGCAHAGLINTLLHVRELVGESRLAGVIGGTHLVDADEARLQCTVAALGGFDIGRLVPCHCTGFRSQVALWEACGERFVANAVGKRFAFGRD